ncbi:hypothetical protein GPJ56_001109 [Histomonas meleagridis]|uniref:uncharacterized protein n=1 Tax=Histomonas meleagridis TaxID=135588 RepID=UPI00355A8691|nr:hypothetical protein GPJ56_001109 [Histomonas meleagridis]KAH0798469.1 hypothetical protein GO595_008739 [Histomonas meleagridis]
MGDFLNRKTNKVCQQFQELYNYTRYEESELEPYIRKIFPNGNPPDFITNSLIFSPLTISFDNDISKIQQSIRSKQHQLQSLLEHKNRLQNRKTNVNTKEIIQKLRDDIQALEAELKEISSSNTYSYTYTYDKSALLLKYNSEIATQEESARQLQLEIQELEYQLKECMSELNKTQATNAMFKEQFDKSTKALVDYRRTLKRLNVAADELNKNRQQLFQRSQNLTQLIQELQISKNNNEKEIHSLDEQVMEYQQLISSYQFLEDQINDQGKQQENALMKMVEAVERYEEYNAETQKSIMLRDSYLQEIKRLKELVNTTTKQFEASLNEHEKFLRNKFEEVIEQIRQKIFSLETENLHLKKDKENYLQRLVTSKQENHLLKIAKEDLGFTKFIETMAHLKAEIESLYSKRNQLNSDITKSTNNIDEINSQLIITGTNARNEQTEMKKRIQMIETEIELQKSTFDEMKEKNAKYSIENQKLRNEILNIQRNSSNECQSKLKNKEVEIQQLKMQIEATHSTNQKSLSEMQQAVLAFRQHADKWKLKTQSINIEANDTKKEIEIQNDDLNDKILGLEKELEKRKILKENCNNMLITMEKQIKELKQQIVVSERKQRNQANVMAQLVSKQNKYNEEIRRKEDLYEKLKVKVKRGKRELDKKDVVNDKYSI